MKILEVLSREINSIGINYSLVTATKPVYPYFTCEPQENGWSFEENKTTGEFLLEGWTRGSWTELFAQKQKIKKHFADFRCVEDGTAMNINFLTSNPVVTGEAELKKIQIRLDFQEWQLDEVL